MKNFFYFVFIVLTACASQKEESVDQWEIPSLRLTKENQGTSTSLAVTKDFDSELDANDRFEFVFREPNREKQQSIRKILVSSRCGENRELTERVFVEEHELGSTASFFASEIVPPQSILENGETVFCAWTIKILNAAGSSISYSLKAVKIVLSRWQPEIKFENLETTLVVPALGSYVSKLVCDLVSIESRDARSVREIIKSESNNESLRRQHPLQRCFVEVLTSTQGIKRSKAQPVFLFPAPLTKINLRYTGMEKMELPKPILVGVAELKNLSDETRNFALPLGGVPFDVLFFDDRGTGGLALPNSDHFLFQRKEGRLEFTGGTQSIRVTPHQQLEIPVYFHFFIPSGCGSGGQYSRAGIRIPLGKEILAAHAPYKDKKGNVIDLVDPSHTQIHNPAPLPYFIKIVHPKLFYPDVYRRVFHEINAGC